MGLTYYFHRQTQNMNQRPMCPMRCFAEFRGGGGSNLQLLPSVNHAQCEVYLIHPARVGFTQENALKELLPFEQC